MKLLHHVESLYQRQVSVVWSDTKNGMLGMSEVKGDGTPEIIIKRQIDDPASTLVHELFHLRDRFHGFPAVISPDKMNVYRLHLTLVQLAELFAMIKDSIAHTMFYGDMRAMGYAPGGAYTSALPRQIADLRQNGTPESRVRRTLMLMQAILESEDQRLVEQLQRELRAAGGASVVTRAEELARHIREKKPTTSADFVALFVTVANDVLRQHKIRIQPARITQEQRGELRDVVAIMRAAEITDRNRARRGRRQPRPVLLNHHEPACGALPDASCARGPIRPGRPDFRRVPIHAAPQNATGEYRPS